MLKLYNKHTGLETTIYGISEDSHGYPKFLIRENKQWVWKSAKHYIIEAEMNKRDNIQ